MISVGLLPVMVMRMKESGEVKARATVAVRTIHRFLDVATVLLLLTGQITIGGVFIAPGGFALSLSGPITGSGAVGKTAQAKLVLDGLDILTALLLVIDEINVIGTYITAGRFTIVVGGPPFGLDKTEAYAPTALEFFDDYREMVFQKCYVDQFGRRG
jgi:hypothetical protein